MKLRGSEGRQLCRVAGLRRSSLCTASVVDGPVFPSLVPLLFLPIVVVVVVVVMLLVIVIIFLTRAEMTSKVKKSGSDSGPREGPLVVSGTIGAWGGSLQRV